MSDQTLPAPGATIRRFLREARRKVSGLVFAQQVCRAAFWVALALVPAAVIVPLLVGSSLARSVLLAALYVAAVLGAGAVWTAARRLRLQNILEGLNLAGDSGDNVMSAAEFA